MLERDAELVRLRDALSSAPSSGGHIVLVRGPAGIGKSLLVRRFLDHVAECARGFLGRCDDLRTPQPLAPVWDVARSSPDVASALADGDRRVVMDALLDLVSHPTQSTVLVFEDTQWADEATLDVITFLGRRIERANGLMILTYRDDEVDDAHPLRRALGEIPPASYERMRLRPLSLHAVTALVGDVKLDPRDVFDLTGGNPLFVSEVVATGSMAVPQSVRDAVLARVAKMTPSARGLVELVSVFPGGAEATVADQLAEPRADDVREARRQGLLHADGDTLTFHHELQRRAVEDSLSPQLRRTLHRDVLACIAERADAARLVHHARGADDDAALLAYAPRAADAALAAGSHREALDHLRAVGPYLDQLPAAQAADIADAWVRTSYHVGAEDAITVLPRAIALRRTAGDIRALGATLAFAVFVFQIHGRSDEAEACALEAVDLLEARPPGRELAYALTEGARLHLVRGDDDAGIALLDRALAIADAEADDRTAASALTLKGSMLHHQGDPRALSLIEGAHRRAAAGGHRFEEADALLVLASKAADVRDLARAIDLAERARTTAARHELWGMETYIRAVIAELDLWTGDWLAAQDHASEAMGVPDAEAIAWRILATIDARRGRRGAAETVERMWAAAGATGEPLRMDPAAGVVAEYLWISGRTDADLLAQLDRELERGLRNEVVWPSGTFAFWMWQLGRLPDVPSRLPDCHRWIMEGDIERAAAFWAARGARYDQALALMHGDDERAVEAVRLMEELGADGSARRLRTELRQRGLRVPRGRSRSSREHAAGLTARQAEVLDLLARGLSNADIAEDLFVSHRTVENHVAVILMKLDVADRHEAVAAARERGLL